MAAVAVGAAASGKRKRSALTKLGVDALTLANQRVLIRVDFNVPFKKVCARRGRCRRRRVSAVFFQSVRHHLTSARGRVWRWDFPRASSRANVTHSIVMHYRITMLRRAECSGAEQAAACS